MKFLGSTIFGGGSGSGDPSYVFTQATPSTSWVILHNTNKFANVQVIDTDGEEVIGGRVTYQSANQLTITFANPETGTAYIN